MQRAGDDDESLLCALEPGEIARDQAEAIDRRAGDAELHMTLALRGFAGVEYERFAEELARYGLAVIGAWIRSGAIFQQCARKGVPLMDSERIEEMDAEELANATVGLAVVRFRDRVLLRNKWNPAGGASLRTFFIGQCLFVFADVYREWLRSQPAQTPTEWQESMLTSATPTVESLVLHSLQLEAVLSTMSPDARTAIIMTSAGYSQEEIATRLGRTRKSVERMLAKERTKQRREKTA